MNDERVLTDDVVVTQPFIGLLYMQVCAYGETPPERVEEAANALNPAGTSGGWHIVLEDPPDWDGKSIAPVSCADNPERLHYILSC